MNCKVFAITYDKTGFFISFRDKIGSLAFMSTLYSPKNANPDNTNRIGATM